MKPFVPLAGGSLLASVGGSLASHASVKALVFVVASQSIALVVYRLTQLLLHRQGRDGACELLDTLGRAGAFESAAPSSTITVGPNGEVQVSWSSASRLPGVTAHVEGDRSKPLANPWRAPHC
jgi:hypothetical protein